MITMTVNRRAVQIAAPPLTRLSDVLREELGLIGTKVGCEAGDCGACTVLLDGQQVCACMVSVKQAEGRHVLTVEGLAGGTRLNALQQAFHRHGAVQCGICTPGMLMAATGLLDRQPRPSRAQVLDALAGVLCRCTGYLKIVEAVLAAGEASGDGESRQDSTGAVGSRLARVDGIARLTGREIYAADAAPDAALWLRAVRSPYARARFRLGDFQALYARFPGLVKILTAADVTGNNGFGIYPHIKDQPVLAVDQVRYRGEAVLALVGDKASVLALSDDQLPIHWQPEQPLCGLEAALADGAPQVQQGVSGNVLARGTLQKGDVEAGFAAAAVIAEGEWRTHFVEHAYIEPEAGYARRVGERLELFVTTQSPYMDRDETAQVIGIAPQQVRVVPSACGGGFGGKLDLSVQPLLALAAWLLERPVRCVYTRPESMAASTKRHPAHIRASAACDAHGKLTAVRFHGDFDTGAYASWGPTVADRVPVHCSGPYYVPHVRASSRAVLSNAPPAGAFRGFGVPQSAIAHEALMDSLAEKIAMDPLQFRRVNAIQAGQATATGQVLEASAGLAECLQALDARWRQWRDAARRYNRTPGVLRRGVGVACMWYGCGNTSMSNPSTMHLGLDRAGNLTLYSGAVDIGQGVTTVLVQIAAQALGVPADRIGIVTGDTDLTADAGKSSASRQTFVSGKAAQRAGQDLRAQLLRLTNAGGDAGIDIQVDIRGARVVVRDEASVHEIELADLPEDGRGQVLCGEGWFDPPTSALDENGQGVPYATYGFAAQIAEVEVDTELGAVKVLRIAAAHDVGRAINPMQVEGQIHGGIAQGLGLALMEEYHPGRTENLHDYLIPTVGDMPDIEVVLVEDAEPLGPYGAKGIGEPALIPTAPAILGAIYHATGARLYEVPATPERIKTALSKPPCAASGRQRQPCA